MLKVDDYAYAAILSESVRRAVVRLTKPGTGKRAGKFTAWGTAMLAKLRRAAGKPPGRNADIWEITIGALPEELPEDVREEAELAVHTALTLFAVHQQSKRESICKYGVGFGKAVKNLIDRNPLNESGLRRRFNAFATASEFSELSYHAGSLVQLMRIADIGFDYPQFAADLYLCQSGDEEERDRVRMRWARDLYAFKKKEHNQEIEEEDQNEQSVH
jgi:CRISPR system Cascade subunit CasB